MLDQEIHIKNDYLLLQNGSDALSEHQKTYKFSRGAYSAPRTPSFFHKLVVRRSLCRAHIRNTMLLEW